MTNDNPRTCSIAGWENVNIDSLPAEEITDSEFSKIIRIMQNTILPCFSDDAEYDLLVSWLYGMVHDIKKIGGAIDISHIPVDEKKLVMAFTNRGWTVHHNRIGSTLTFSKYGRLTLFMIL